MRTAVSRLETLMWHLFGGGVKIQQCSLYRVHLSPHCRVCPRFRPPRTFDAALALDDALLLLLPLPLRCVLLLLLQLRPWVWSRPAG